MKKTIAVGVIAFLITAGLALASGPAPKATIKHKGKKITVSCHAVAAHRAHGDGIDDRRCKKIIGPK